MGGEGPVGAESSRTMAGGGVEAIWEPVLVGRGVRSFVCSSCALGWSTIEKPPED